MKFLTYFILFFGMFFASQLKAASAIHVNLFYFFQEPKVNQTKVLAFEIELESFIKYLRQFDQDPPKKRIDRIAVEIEKKYFKTYVNYASVFEFFERGYHNAISAVAVQAIILNELKIPFKIEERETGLALIAYPDKDKIIVPYSGKKDILYWNNTTQNYAANCLINMDLVTLAQVNTGGAIVLDKYFKVNRTLTLKELSGLALMKQGMVALEKNDYAQGIELLTIGKKNYSDPRFGYLAFDAMSNSLDDLAYDNILIMDYLLQLYDLTRSKALLDRLKGNIEHVYYVALNERRDFTFTDSSKVLVESNLHRIADKNLIMSELYSHDMSFYYYKRNEDKALESGKQGLKYNPNNFEIQDKFTLLLTESLLNSLDTDYGDFDQFKRVEDSLNYYISQYPFIAESQYVKSTLISLKAEEMGEAFNANNYEIGKSLVEELDLLLTNYDFKDSEVNEIVADGYSDVAVYYYREKNYTLALEWIDKALGLDPTSEFIKSRKQNILDHM